jgi:hypothetical protein
VSEQVLLQSKDERSLLVVSYADIKVDARATAALLHCDWMPTHCCSRCAQTHGLLTRLAAACCACVLQRCVEAAMSEIRTRGAGSSQAASALMRPAGGQAHAYRSSHSHLMGGMR